MLLRGVKKPIVFLVRFFREISSEEGGSSNSRRHQVFTSARELSLASECFLDYLQWHLDSMVLSG